MTTGEKHYNTHNRHGEPRPHFPLELPRVWLEIVRGRARLRVRPVVVSTFLVGTAKDGDLVLSDPQFAGAHFYLRRSHGGVSLRHLGAAPEVTVNGTVVRKTALFDGDRIRTGPYEFRLHVRWPSTKPREQRQHEEPPQSENAILLSRRLVADVRAAMGLDPQGARLRLFATDEPNHGEPNHGEPSLGDRCDSPEEEGVHRSPVAAPKFATSHGHSTSNHASGERG